jgi:hypothetical protein
MLKRLLTTAISWLVATAAGAQERAMPSPTVMLPGSLNVSVGNTAPSEQGNVLMSATTEQGVTLWQKDQLFLTAFVTVTARHDSDGLPWNRRVPLTGGGKLVWIANGGVLQAAAGATGEMRNGEAVDVQPSVSATYWAGWRLNQFGTSRLGSSSFPGQLYAATGVMTASEPGNWTSFVTAQQGVTVFQHKGVAAVPFVGASMSMDSRGYSWNNRAQFDAGVKMTHSAFGGALEAGVAKRHDHLRMTGQTHVATVVFVNYWLGWSARVSR